MIDCENQAKHRAYLEAKLGITLQPDAQFIANAEPYGVAAFERYTGDDVEFHYSGEPGFLTRPFIRACARYIFNQLGCARVTGRASAFRPKGIEMAMRVGFKHEGTLRQAYKGTDIYVFGMLREECRWL
jgi:RimJ/RimL family protein N-acetyltransferase